MNCETLVIYQPFFLFFILSLIFLFNFAKNNQIVYNSYEKFNVFTQFGFIMYRL